MNAAQFAAALDHAAAGVEDALTSTVRIHFVSGYRDFLGLAPVDTGLHRAALAPFKGESSGGTITRDRDRDYPSPGDGLARTVAAGFKLGDTIGFEDQAKTDRGFAYGIMIQTPKQRSLLGFPAGSRPAVSPKAREGSYGKVYERWLEEVPRDLEAAVQKKFEEAER